MRLCLLGALLAVGTWVRFTFPAFALPVVLDLAWNVVRNDKEEEDGKDADTRTHETFARNKPSPSWAMIEGSRWPLSSGNQHIWLYVDVRPRGAEEGLGPSGAAAVAACGA